MQPTIARNPSTYEGLLEWLRQYGDADVQAALDEREGVSAAPPAPPAPPAPIVVETAPTPAEPVAPATAPASSVTAVTVPAATSALRAAWTEPSRALPVTWLNYDLRYTLALAGVGLAALFHIVVSPLMTEQMFNTMGWAPYELRNFRRVPHRGPP